MKLSISPLLATLIPLVLATGPSYFHITKPAGRDQWTQGQPHAANWVHGVDGIDVIDVELGRMNSPGLLLGAREVPAAWGSVNLLLADVPPGDDYYLIFLNVTHGVVYSISDTFTILPPSITTSANSTSQIGPDPSKPTVTVTGVPNPTMQFSVTYGPQAAGAMTHIRSLDGGARALLIASTIFSGLIAGVCMVI